MRYHIDKIGQERAERAGRALWRALGATNRHALTARSPYACVADLIDQVNEVLTLGAVADTCKAGGTFFLGTEAHDVMHAAIEWVLLEHLSGVEEVSE